MKGSILDMLNWRCLLDIYAEISCRQLDINVWNSEGISKWRYKILNINMQVTFTVMVLDEVTQSGRVKRRAMRTTPQNPY